MQNKKGLYLLLTFIGTILIFFCILFFVHERTLENGILFTVSFHYKNAQDISYNFYNQSGKIEKVEVGEGYKNTLFLEKTEYKSVKLLRKLLKNLKEQKEISSEEGITIYNGQNKRYYLLPFSSDAAKELSELIIDGYIHTEMKRITSIESRKEIYLYEHEDTISWTNNGAEKRIIHTYQCNKEDCNGIYSDSNNNETVLKDDKIYLYNYITKTKEEINSDEEIIHVKFLKNENHLIGLELTNNENLNAYYDLTKKETLTSYQKQEFQIINHDFILETQKTPTENQSNFALRVWNRFTKEEKWKINKIDQNDIQYQIQELQNDTSTYYLLTRIQNKKATYQILDSNWKEWNDFKIYEEVELTNDNILKLGIQKDNKMIYEKYDKDGNRIKETEKDN